MAKRVLGNQSGAGAVNLILVTTFSMAAVYAVSTQISGALKLKASTNEGARLRQRHEAAAQFLSQLVNTGALYQDRQDIKTGANFQGTNRCQSGTVDGKNGYTPPGDQRWCYVAGSNTFVARICETKAKGADAMAKGICSDNQQLATVSLSLTGVEKGDEAQESFGNFKLNSRFKKQGKWSEFNSVARIKTHQKNKIDKFVSNTDFCYFMRPASNNLQDLGSAYNTKGGIGGSLANLEPREEGDGENQFRGKFTLGDTSRDPMAYEILRPLRAKLYAEYTSKALRGTALRSADSKTNTVFVGVTPRNNDAQFQYFLAAAPGVGHRSDYSGNAITAYQNPTVRDPAYGQDFGYQYKLGCATTTGAQYGNLQAGNWNAPENRNGPDFCTRVHVPYKSYQATLATRCVEKIKTLAVQEIENVKRVCERVPVENNNGNNNGGNENGGNNQAQEFREVCRDEVVKTEQGEKFAVNLRDQLICNPAWPDVVNSVVAAIEPSAAEYGRTQKQEVTITEYAAFMDLAGSGLALAQARHGAAAGNAMKNGVNTVTTALKGAPLKGELSRESFPGDLVQLSEALGQTTVTFTGRSDLRQVKYYVMESLAQPEIASSHTSQRCAYFRYYNADNPQTCKVDVLTQGTDADGWWVCRTNDGCFDASTRIRLADGSEKTIVDLKRGDLVWNPRTGKAQEIDHMTIGPEKETMYRIGYSGRIVEVTKTHPFFTEQGWAQAQNLTLGSQVLDEGNIFRKLEVAEPFKKENPPTVVNLVLKGDANNPDEHFVLANGVVTGDLIIQNKLEKGEIK